MVKHWLSCPVGTYVGSSYGNPVNDALQSSITSSAADLLVTKLKTDLPILNDLSDGSINIYEYSLVSDRKQIILDIAGTEFEVQA